MTLPCVFCNKRCNHNSMRQTYWCKTCKVNYDGDKEYLHNMTFDTTIKNIQYELTIDVEKDNTKLCYWDVYTGYSPTGGEPDILRTLLEFHPAMKGITPENVKDKIKTLLTYS